MHVSGVEDLHESHASYEYHQSLTCTQADSRHPTLRPKFMALSSLGKNLTFAETSPFLWCGHTGHPCTSTDSVALALGQWWLSAVSSCCTLANGHEPDVRRRFGVLPIGSHLNAKLLSRRGGRQEFRLKSWKRLPRCHSQRSPRSFRGWWPQSYKLRCCPVLAVR